jgi:hypothetical protein
MHHILVKNLHFYQAFAENQIHIALHIPVRKLIIPFIILFGPTFPTFAQVEDSLSIQYSIVGMMFYGDHDVLKITVPPWMKSSELVFQIKKAVIPDEKFPPTKKTYIYVFKETDQVGATSKTGAVYFPGRGFRWDLKDWRPIQFPDTIPTEKDFEIYDDFIDTIIQEGLTLTNIESRQKVAAKYQITLAHLDSICAYVKYWLNRQQNIKQ